MAAKKPTKQQIAQAKARAGGNTTSKTTPARMAKGAKDIALFAATIAGPGKVAKVATTAAKAARASSPVSKRVAANKIDRAEQMLKLNKDIKTKEDAAVWATHPGAASFKSNQRLVKQGKWSSPKQIARYQRQEAKAEIKSEKRALKAANKPTRASKNPEIKMTEKLAKVSKGLGQKEPYATRNAARTVDDIRKLNRAKKKSK